MPVMVLSSFVVKPVKLKRNRMWNGLFCGSDDFINNKYNYILYKYHLLCFHSSLIGLYKLGLQIIINQFYFLKTDV